MIDLYYQKRTLILTCIAAIAAGCILHFIYGWWPNAFTALFSPINDSLWEHVKLIYWPSLAAALFLSRGRPGAVRPWLLILPLLCGAMLILGWVYHISLGGEAMWVDLTIYGTLMVLGFWLPPRFSGPFRGPLWVLPILATAVLGAAIAIFTLYPPDSLLFRDLSTVGSWLFLPC